MDFLSYGNLMQAYKRARKSRKNKQEVYFFDQNLEQNLLNMYSDLKNKKYIHRKYTKIILHDSKKRYIHSPSFRDHILHHMMYKSLYNTLDKKLIFSTFACRRGYGTHKTILYILNEEAFFIAKTFNFKLTALDKQNIKIGFPNSSKDKWLKILEDKKLGYVLHDEKNNLEFIKNGKYFSSIFSVDIEDYNLTLDRILKLKEFNLENQNIKNFLLKDKLEDIYLTLSELLLKLPKKERYFFREKIERLFLDLFEQVYIYMYNLGDRKIIIKIIFNKTMILREFTRFLYKLGKIKNDNVYLNLGDRWIEILKICKGIVKKN